MAQLSINLTAIVLAGVATLFLQRRLYKRRRSAISDDGDQGAGGRSETIAQPARRRRERHRQAMTANDA